MKKCSGVQGQSPWSGGQGVRGAKPPEAETLLAFGCAMHGSRKFACFNIWKRKKNSNVCVFLLKWRLGLIIHTYHYQNFPGESWGGQRFILVRCSLVPRLLTHSVDFINITLLSFNICMFTFKFKLLFFTICIPNTFLFSKKCIAGGRVTYKTSQYRRPTL